MPGRVYLCVRIRRPYVKSGSRGSARQYWWPPTFRRAGLKRFFNFDESINSADSNRDWMLSEVRLCLPCIQSDEAWVADTVPSSDYICFASRAYHCVSEVSSGSVLSGDANSFCGKYHTTSVNKYKAASSTNMYADAPCIVLVDDVSRLESTNTTTSSPLSTAFTTSIATKSNTTGADSGGDASRGLSTGAKAAIGVSIPLVAILVAVALLVFFRRRSRRATQTSVDGAAEHEGPDTAYKVEMDGSEPRQSTILGSPAPRGVSTLSDDSTIYGQGAGNKRASELYGSLATPRLHEDIMELPVETDTHITR